MIVYEDECVGCGLPCYGSACPNRNVPHFYCDECGDETELYLFDDNKELCVSCLLDKFERIC